MKKWVVLNKIPNLGKREIDLANLILEGRRIIDAKAQQFLNPPSFADYLKQTSRDFRESIRFARDLINQTISNNMPIIIYGDYDADGICATAILYKAIRSHLGYDKVSFFIPNRFDHGYGLSLESLGEVKLIVDKLSSNINGSGNLSSAKPLIITVDCGITADKKVLQEINNLGFNLIITDHHQKGKEIPPANVVVWNDAVCGSAISLILALSLGLKDEAALCLAGVATVTDLLPLLDFNRYLVKKSLDIINKNPPLGLKKLLEVTGRLDKEITTYDYGYIIGPRLNAAGRLDTAYNALELLLTDNQDEAVQIARNLDFANKQRQDLTQRLYELAESIHLEVAQSDLSIPYGHKIIMVASQDFHEGVIGLVAGKLVQKYHKPAIAISISEEFAKGSVRSVSRINIINLLRKLENLFVSLGGHPMAAGFSARKEKLLEIKEKLIALADEYIQEDDLIPVIDIDLELPLDFVDDNLLEAIYKLKPFGVANPEPVFLSRDVGLADFYWFGEQSEHAVLKFFDGKRLLKAILFDAKNFDVSNLSAGKKLDIVFSVQDKIFNGQRSLELVIKDFVVSS